MKEFIIKDEVFKTEVLFITNCGYKEATKRLKRRGFTEELDEYTIGTVVKAKGSFFRIVWLEKFSFKKEHFCNLIHELFHLVVRIMQDKGVPIKANIETGECGDETAAYLLEYYVGECMKILKRKQICLNI